MIDVNTNKIKSVSYDLETSMFFCRMKNDEVILYANVPKEAFKEFIETDNKDEYYVNNIKNNNYEHHVILRGVE